MNGLFIFSEAKERDPGVQRWIEQHSTELGVLGNYWFEKLRHCGDDVAELMHDGCPTACVGKAAFAYVGVYNAHVSIGFFKGAEIADPNGLLQGSGKSMRHVKVRPQSAIDERTLCELIQTAYLDMKARIEAEKLLVG